MGVWSGGVGVGIVWGRCLGVDWWCGVSVWSGGLVWKYCEIVLGVLVWGTGVEWEISVGCSMGVVWV